MTAPRSATVAYEEVYETAGERADAVPETPRTPTFLELVLAGPAAEAAPRAPSPEGSSAELAPEAASAAPPRRYDLLWVRGVLDALRRGEQTPEAIRRRLVADLSAVDRALTAQLREIFRHPRLRQLEASWRSLRDLVDRVADRNELISDRRSLKPIKVRVLDCSKKRLADDLDGAIEFDGSGIFRKVYEDHFGSPGGEPFGLLVGDYEFSASVADVETLRKMSGVAAAAFAPFIASAAPALLGLDSFEPLSRPIRLDDAYAGKRHIPWRSFRSDHPDGKFLGLVCPRTLVRRRLEDENHGLPFEFREVLGSDPLWGSAAYAFAGVVVDSYAETGWLASIRGERGGRTRGRVADEYDANPRGLIPKPVTDAVIDERREPLLAELGLITACQLKDSTDAIFPSAPSVHQPATYDTEEATASERLSSTLPYTLCASRIAHNLKVLLRDQLGRSADVTTLQNHLNEWLSNYVTNAAPDGPTRARYPLREGRVTIDEPLPGRFHMTMHIMPHFQLEGLSVAMRLTSRMDA